METYETALIQVKIQRLEPLSQITLKSVYLASWAAYFGPKCKSKVKLKYAAETTTLLPKFR